MFSEIWSELVKFLAKRPRGFEKNRFSWGADPLFEKGGSHTLPHTNALLAERTWSRLTLLLCQVRKGPPRPILTCLSAFTDRQGALGESFQRCNTKPQWMCKQIALAGVSEGDVLWSNNCGHCRSSSSMKRRVLGGCVTWCTCPSVARLSTSFRTRTIGVYFIVILLLQMRLQGLVLKRRLLNEENGEEGLGGWGSIAPLQQRMRHIQAYPRKTFKLRVPGNHRTCMRSYLSVKLEQKLERCFRQISQGEVVVVFQLDRDRITGKHLSATIGWPEHCQQRRSIPVTASLHHWIGAQHSVGKTKRSPIAHRSSFDLTYHYLFLYVQAKFWTFHPHTARFFQHSRGNRRQETTRMVEIDRSIEGRDSPLSELEQWTIAPVNFSVTWHVTSERVCWVK